MNYIIYDNIHDNNGFIAEALIEKGIGIKEIYSPVSRYKCISWIMGAVKAIQKSSSGDRLIFWYDFQGVICFWICRLFLLRRNMILLNLLLKNKPTLRNKLVSRLYKPALQSSRVRATVTSLEYGRKLNKQLQVIVSYTLLRDVYPFAEKEESEWKDCGNTVFCGGNNGRDWNLSIQIAGGMPEVRFVFVMPRAVMKSIPKGSLPGNIHLFCDIALDEFNRLLQESSIVMLPLDTDAPAGLIVLFQAASQQKLVVATSTPVTKEYLDQESGVLCKHDSEQYRKEISFYLRHPDMARSKGKALHDRLKSECSKDIYTNHLYNLVASE